MTRFPRPTRPWRRRCSRWWRGKTSRPRCVGRSAPMSRRGSSARFARPAASLTHPRYALKRDSEREAVAMRRALELAWRGWGHVSPNPLVGAVLLRGNDVVGEGWHAEFGGPHAEINALKAAGDKARGATLVVTLEPCAHHGETPRRPPVRIVFDRRAMLNQGVSLVETAREVPTWVVASPQAPAANVAVLEANGVRVFRPQALAQAFAQLRLAGIQSLLCEGGGALGTKLLTEGLVDRLFWIQAPVWLGEGAVPAFPGVPAFTLADAPRWVVVERRALGSDTLLVLDRRLCLPES